MSEQNGDSVTGSGANGNAVTPAGQRNAVTLPFKRYRCFKIVEALRICWIERRQEMRPVGDDTAPAEPVIVQLQFSESSSAPVSAMNNPDPALFARYSPLIGDYLVRYEDGYLSISPKKAFEDGYRLLAEDGA